VLVLNFSAVLCLYLHWKRVLWKWRTRKTEELKLDILENERQTRNRILGPIIWQTEKWLDFLDFVATLIITYQIITPTQCFVTTWRSCTTRAVCDLSHTHPRLTALCPGLPGWADTRKVKTNLDFTEARDSEWQWHQLDYMQVCTSLQTDNHTSTPPLSFLRTDALPAAQPTASKHWRPRSVIYHRNKNPPISLYFTSINNQVVISNKHSGNLKKALCTDHFAEATTSNHNPSHELRPEQSGQGHFIQSYHITEWIDHTTWTSKLFRVMGNNLPSSQSPN